MDWPALLLSLQVALCTVAVLLPIGIWVGRGLAWTESPRKGLVVALLALPLVLPPTVLGYYLLVVMSGTSPLGRWYDQVVGHPLAFSFDGLLVASVVCNLPFAVLPIQRAFEAIDSHVREAALCCGLSRRRILWRIELPLAWPGILSAIVLTFAHTLGEFGVVLMVGGNIPGQTRTLSIAIYDRVQAFDNVGAGAMSALLLVMSLGAIWASYLTTGKLERPHA